MCVCVCVCVFTFVSVSLAACTHSLYWTAAAAAEQPNNLISVRLKIGIDVVTTLHARSQSNANKLTHAHIHSHTVSTGRRCRRTAGDFGGRTGPGRSRTKIYALGMRTDKRRARARDPVANAFVHDAVQCTGRCWAGCTRDEGGGTNRSGRHAHAARTSAAERDSRRTDATPTSEYVENCCSTDWLAGLVARVVACSATAHTTRASAGTSVRGVRTSDMRVCSVASALVRLNSLSFARSRVAARFNALGS